MSKDFSAADEDVKDDVDWNSFLDMDYVEDRPSHEIEQLACGQEAKHAPSGASSVDPMITEDVSTSSLNHQAYSHNVSDLIPPLRQTHTIDANYVPHLRQIDTIDSILHDSRSFNGPYAVDYPDPSVMSADMDWLLDGSAEAMQPPLGSFVHPEPTQVPISFPPLVSPCSIDPALMGPMSGQGGSRLEWSDHQSLAHSEGLGTLVEPDLDSRLRNALLNFERGDGSQSRPSPRQHHDRMPPLPPANSPHLQPFPLPTYNPPLASSLSPLSSPASPLTTPKRMKSRSRARSGSFTPQADTQGPCLTCGKNYRTSTSPGRCARCGTKWERHTAGPPTFSQDPAVPDLDTSREMLYPISRGRQRPDDDVRSWLLTPGIQDVWVHKWLEALNTPVPHTGKDQSGVKASWASNQQTTFNQKAKMDREGEYSPALVTARLRALWWEVVVFHDGGRSLYPVGGDSAGYSEDLELRFGERLEAIADVMKVDKRTVMDVVEGRGVGAFVGNPWGFHKRKDSNNGCNVKKKDVLKRHRGDTRTPEGRRGGRKRASRASSVGVMDDDDGSRWDEDEGNVDPDGRPVDMAE